VHLSIPGVEGGTRLTRVGHDADRIGSDDPRGLLRGAETTLAFGVDEPALPAGTSGVWPQPPEAAAPTC
jgi:hypothetical protein